MNIQHIMQKSFTEMSLNEKLLFVFYFTENIRISSEREQEAKELLQKWLSNPPENFPIPLISDLQTQN